MAKQTHKLKENIRNMTLQIKDIAGQYDELDKRLVALAIIIRRNGLEDLIADVPQSAASIGRANLALDQHFDAIPGTLQPVLEIERAKPMESRNTPKKKHNRQKWCYRLAVIRSECNVAVDDLTTNRAYGNKTRRNKNWNSIQRAAKTVVIHDDSKQDLPLVGMIFVYAARLRLKVLELAQVAQVEHNSVASLYESRAASLLALMREIKTAHGNKFSANPDW